MCYNDRVDMKNGDLLFFKGSGFFSKLIKWGTNSKYSHIAICVNADMNLAIEAQGRVRAQDIRKMFDYDVYRVKPEYEYNLTMVVSYLVNKLNNPYDYAGVIFLGLLKILHLKNTANKWQRDRDYFCSELGINAFNNGNLNLTPQIIGAGVGSPADIIEGGIIGKVNNDNLHKDTEDIVH